MVMGGDPSLGVQVHLEPSLSGLVGHRPQLPYHRTLRQRSHAIAVTALGPVDTARQAQRAHAQLEVGNGARTNRIGLDVPERSLNVDSAPNWILRPGDENRLTGDRI